jgi:hypothetical protein
MTLGLSTPASAGIFERIFGGLRQAVEAPAHAPEVISSFADPLASPRNSSSNSQPQRRADIGPAKAFCVRTCDGHFFPVQARAGLSAAEACHSFCPGSQTKLYSGSNIDYAVASDGSRYGDLANAFVYRKQLVAGCTCNGRSPFGLARMEVNSDPTLRRGDVVATKEGMVTFTGTKNNVADFTPVGADRNLPKSTRDKLSDVKIMPPTPASGFTPVMLRSSLDRIDGDNPRSAQLSR